MNVVSFGDKPLAGEFSGINGNEINDGTNVNDRCDYNYYSITIFPERGFDCDGDGITNWQEVVNSKTNPQDSCDFDLEFIDDETLDEIFTSEEGQYFIDESSEDLLFDVDDELLEEFF